MFGGSVAHNALRTCGLFGHADEGTLEASVLFGSGARSMNSPLTLQATGIESPDAFILGPLDGVAFVRFGHEDVVRHKLVQRIVEAYRKHAEETGTQRRK